MKLLNILLVMLFIVFGFSGCSGKKVDTPTEQVKNVSVDETADDDEDDFGDEFEDEFKTEAIFDPLSGYNRVMTDINDKLYTYVLEPVAKGYKYVLHEEVRSSIGKFFHNLLYPLRFVNNVLQLKFKNAMEETGRFLVNSTVGLLGFFDPAKSYLEWDVHNEDFGQTLGFYGVGAGPHIVLPILGPSNLRDTFSLYPDYALDPKTYVGDRSYNLANDSLTGLGYATLEKINFISQHTGEYDMLKKDAVDLYPFLRDIYEQRRIQLIKE